MNVVALLIVIAVCLLVFLAVKPRSSQTESEQNEAVGAVSLCQTLLQDADDDFIGHQSTGVHKALGLQTHLGALLDSSAQDVAGADGGDVQLCADDLGLGAFARAGCA